jgi:1,2-diacylglycerol 3-beta-galactosyltransferase
MKRFLFLFSDTGGGHRASAQAVKGELERLYGEQQSVDMVDVFVALGQWPFLHFPEWYPAAVGFSGIPWGLGFHLSDDVGLMKTMSKLVWPYARTAMCRLLLQHPADVIVSFHPIPNCSLFLGLRQLGVNTPVAVVALDLVTTHASWFVPGADLYLAPTPAARARALRWGVAPDRVHVRGMPTRRSFVTAMQLPQEEARARLGLPSHQPIVLIVGGGEGMGPLETVVRTIARAARDKAQVVVITGRNRALYEALSRSRMSDTPLVRIAPSGLTALPHRPGREGTRWVSRSGSSSIRIEGFVDNMEVWMRAADILVTKAGPNSVAEAFIAGLPMVLYTALPGQEEGNVTYVVKNGAGMWAPLPRQAARAVVQLLTDPSARQTMAARSSALANPMATEQIAQDLWALSCREPDQRPAEAQLGGTRASMPLYLNRPDIRKRPFRRARSRQSTSWESSA